MFIELINEHDLPFLLNTESILQVFPLEKECSRIFLVGHTPLLKNFIDVKNSYNLFLKVFRIL